MVPNEARLRYHFQGSLHLLKRGQCLQAMERAGLPALGWEKPGDLGEGKV